MSVEEDTELRDLVAQTLEANGCLAKIRAQLRASIFIALDEDECLQKKEPLLNKKVKDHLESAEGRLMFCVVREFLEFFDLDFTISVYEPESYLGVQYCYEGRCKIVQDLGIPQLEKDSSLPMLLQLIHIAQLKVNTETSNLRGEERETLTCDHNSNPLNNNNPEVRKCVNKTDVEISNCGKSETSVTEQVINTEDSNDSVELEYMNKLNQTFHVSSPVGVCQVSKINGDNEKKDLKQQSTNYDVISSPREFSSSIDDVTEKDDTFEGTSSIAEDSEKENDKDHQLIDLDKSVKPSGSSSGDSDRSRTLLDQPVTESEFSPPVVKDSKHLKFDSSFEKLKLSPQKSEKLKSKNSLTSLSDLPPLPMSKSRSNDMLLPSLYSKEFKEKSTSKEIDKMFDLDSLDNYEEDFMSGSEIDLVLNKTDDALAADESKINLLKDSKKLTNGFEFDSEPNNSSNKQVDEHNVSKNVFKNGEHSNSDDTTKTEKVSSNNTTESFCINERNHSTASSITSEDFEFNSKLDDILHSITGM